AHNTASCEHHKYCQNHYLPLCVMAHNGLHFAVLLTTPTPATQSRHTNTNCSIPPVGSQLPGRASGATVMVNRPSPPRTISSLVKPCRSIALATSRPSGV